MSFRDKALHEVKAVGFAALYFGCWIASFLVIKQIILADYQIQFQGFSAALVGALILSKVVLVLERVPLGSWVASQPAWVDIVLRTLLYAAGVLVVLLLEKGFEGRHEHGGFIPSLQSVFQHRDIYHVWGNAICLTGALLVFNTLVIVRLHMGEGGLSKIFLKPRPAENE